MTDRFTWMPLYRELADLLCSWDDRQAELIDFLENLRKDGVVVTPLNDQDKDGTNFLIQEIDPFTVFATFNRQIREAERLAILTGLKQLLGAKEPLPADFWGLPVEVRSRSCTKFN